MKYSIGAGLILDQVQHNFVRNLELEITRNTNNSSGLCQPPHVTVKRPFTVGSTEDVVRYAAMVAQIAKETQPIELCFQEPASFSHSTVYLPAVATDGSVLMNLHRLLLDAANGAYSSAQDAYEGTAMVFHSSIALGLSEQQHLNTMKLLRDKVVSHEHFTLNRLGLFLSIDEGKNWIIVHESLLG
jgi:hypothetical protein